LGPIGHLLSQLEGHFIVEPEVVGDKKKRKSRRKNDQQEHVTAGAPTRKSLPFRAKGSLHRTHGQPIVLDDVPASTPIYSDRTRAEYAQRQPWLPQFDVESIDVLRVDQPLSQKIFWEYRCTKGV
jgi:hypothetical protein